MFHIDDSRSGHPKHMSYPRVAQACHKRMIPTACSIYSISCATVLAPIKHATGDQCYSPWYELTHFQSLLLSIRPPARSSVTPSQSPRAVSLLEIVAVIAMQPYSVAYICSRCYLGYSENILPKSTRVRRFAVTSAIANFRALLRFSRYLCV